MTEPHHGKPRSDEARNSSAGPMMPFTAANQVTLARIVLIPVFLVALLGRFPNAGPWIAAALFAVLAATDAVDGHLARSRNEVTTFGKFIDPLADKLLVTAALVALVELQALPAWIALVIISREFIVTGLRLVAVAEGRVVVASRGGKTKTVFQVIAIIAFILKDLPELDLLVTPAGTVVFAWLSWAIMTVALILTVTSMVEYFYHARDILSGPWTQRR